MAYGGVYVPGVGGPELEAVLGIAQSAMDDASIARNTAVAAQYAAEKAAEELEKVNQAIEEAGGIGGGGSWNTLKITFEPAFIGQTYTVTDGDDTSTGTVPESGVVTVRASNSNSTYIIKATANNGVEYSTSVTTGAYYGQYNIELTVFSAAIHVTAVPDAEVKAVIDGEEFTATADNTGLAVIQVNKAGTYLITATINGVSSGNASVAVETAEEVYTATVRFITLKVTSPVGSVLTVRKKE